VADHAHRPRTGIELWNAHDRQGCVGIFDDDADLEAPRGIRVRGRSGAELFYDTWHEAFPDNSIADALVLGASHPEGDTPPTEERRVPRRGGVPRAGGQVASFHMYFESPRFGLSWG
jgi:hypothetical protein